MAVLLTVLITLASNAALGQVNWNVTSDDANVRACFQQNMMMIPGWESTYVAHLSIGPEGAVAGVMFDGVPEGSNLENCLAEAYSVSGPWEEIEGETIDLNLVFQVSARGDSTAVAGGGDNPEIPEVLS